MKTYYANVTIKTDIYTDSTHTIKSKTVSIEKTGFYERIQLPEYWDKFNFTRYLYTNDIDTHAYTTYEDTAELEQYLKSTLKPRRRSKK